jgi:methyl-accepting chemotaxis protein
VPSETLAEAMDNLATYNARVEEVLARDDLSVSDMEEIHQYTDTMEQAVARIATSMDDIAALLEEVHLASEGDDTEDLRDTAAAYPERTAPLTD